MANQQQVNEIARKLALLLIDNGMKILQSAFHLTPIKMSYGDMDTILKKHFSTAPITHLDTSYNLLPAPQWRELIRVDWVDTKKWILHYRDCDNFSEAFAANMSMFFEINSAGRVYGDLYRGNTNELVGRHYWNVFVTSDKEIFFLEPNSDALTKYEGGTLLIGGNRYEVISFRFG